jgi:murein L,D-transpeptidase YcbB/YkuD
MDKNKYNYVNFPNSDSLDFTKSIYIRLAQSGYGNPGTGNPDLEEYREALINYQKDHHLEPDGKAGPAVVKSLNSNDEEKFRHVAITLDKYKSAPLFPETYIEVNIPSFHLKLVDADSIVLISKTVVGKPSTSTPELISSISNMVIYPQWTVPESIIRNDFLPHLKYDPGYLLRKGFSILDTNGNEVNPYTVDWSKYTRGIPWRVVQGSGDDNALGIFKFNFNNPYSVYLHDTNQRYLFKNENRALSHGCVRVEKWHALASFIAKRDSTALKPGQIAGYNTDSINNWINKKERKTIILKKRLPIYINYFTCVAKNGKIVFYNDVYKEDYRLAMKYFYNK